MLRAENPQRGSSADEKKCMRANILTNIIISMSNGQILLTNITKMTKGKTLNSNITNTASKDLLTSDLWRVCSSTGSWTFLPHCDLQSVLVNIIIAIVILIYNFSPTLGPAISSCCKSCQIFLRSVAVGTKCQIFYLQTIFQLIQKSKNIKL